MLSDAGNKLARELGIVWKQPDDLRPLFKQSGTDLEQRYGKDSFELPVPVTFLVNRNDMVRNVCLEADYRKRLEPETAMEWIARL